jgi:osmotically-inducible protein OsmY
MNDTRDSHGLEEEIASAFARDIKLKGSSIRVKVDDDAVTLEGRAAGSEERLQAARLAQSYAWNRKVVDHVEVASRVSAQK